MSKQFLGTSAGSALLDAFVAGFAAAAVAFVAWAMPNEIFERIVSASGLPMLLPAAAPPLGETARLGVMLGAAGALFVLLFAALRMIGRVPARSYIAPASIRAPVAPRLRRADAHPDAPSRAPILATLELGTPLSSPWPEPAPIEQAEQESEPLDLDAWSEPAIVEIELEPEPAPVPAYESMPTPTRQPAPRRLGNESIAELMQRLERGLSVKSEPATPVAPAATPQPELDDRLRSAIEDLQRLAARS